jgi:N-formylmaleamate deformylase
MALNYTADTVIVNRTKLHYFHKGIADKPVLVLVHGFSDNGLCWEPVAEELKDACDIYMPEMRGHGLSERVQPGVKFDMAADLHGFIHSLGLSHPVVAGHSMGASIAFHFGARFAQLPAALILEDPPWFDAVPDHYRERNESPSPFEEMVASWQGQTAEMLVERYRQEHQTWSEATLRAWCEAKTQLDPKFLAVDNMPLADWKEVLKKITCPILLITADPELGGIVTPAMARTAQEINPNVQIAHFPGVGHHIRFAVHDAYMKKVKEFLAEINARG